MATAEKTRDALGRYLVGMNPPPDTSAGVADDSDNVWVQIGYGATRRLVHITEELYDSWPDDVDAITAILRGQDVRARLAAMTSNKTMLLFSTDGFSEIEAPA